MAPVPPPRSKSRETSNTNQERQVGAIFTHQQRFTDVISRSSPKTLKSKVHGDRAVYFEAGDEGTASSSGVAPRLIVSYGLGHVLNDLSASIWFFYAVIYCQQVLGIPPDTTGAVVLIGQVVDGLTTPLVGYASDHTRTPIGPRKPWHIFGVCCVAITFPLVFGGCSIGAEPGNALRAFCPPNSS